VVGRRFVSKDRLPGAIFSTEGPPVLTVITCGGTFDSATHHYADNVIVYAVPAG
jgi:hypothetical protein